MVDDGYFSVCLNTDPYTFLGSRPLHLAPGTSADSELSVVTFETLALRTMLPVLGSALGQGDKLMRHRHVSLARGVSAATVKGWPVPYQLDGDFVGESEQIELTWEAEALSVVVPLVTPAPSGRGTGATTDRPLARRRLVGTFLKPFLKKVCRRPLRGSQRGLYCL